MEVIAWISYKVITYSVAPACAWTGAAIGTTVGSYVGKCIANKVICKVKNTKSLTINKSKIYIVYNGELVEIDPRKRYIIERDELVMIDIGTDKRIIFKPTGEFTTKSSSQSDSDDTWELI